MSQGDTQLVPVRESYEMEILRNLVPLYLHDLSAYTPELRPNEKGMFEYEGLPLYEQDDRLKAFLIFHETRVAGFLMLNQPPYTAKDVDYCVNELFILKGYRHKGIARAAVQQIFRQYRGKYLIFQLAGNAQAISFWKKVYELNGIPFSEKEELYDGELCNFQRFETGAE
ncbi:GNAT family N-acetyltransferase [Paenibacillus sp. P96]|uniref:GNAT family N-acetyltransferase n=1 Tax=Paenibacillus zeirhizosphaerae TaxID=2987519 RepID=A0ABT9FVT8_9BACL|nr:GNAT family N-acetyltransferase [Paenibacillus sp. P96]MDP4098853.1 GNAT family N-acetyltransferase [Paenibacillus sp. P96]